MVAVDTGSTDGTSGLLAASNQVDVVLRMPRDTGFAEAVHTAVDDAGRRWGRDGRNSSGDWLWVLHDDAAPAPDCLEVLLSVADAVIVGSSVKQDGRWDRAVDPARAAAFVKAARG